MSQLPDIQRFNSTTGVRIYRIPCEAFPKFVAHVHLLLGGQTPTLVDTGSGFGECTGQLIRGLEAVRDEHGEQVALADIKRIVITHGHIDHFGGLPQLLDRGMEAAVGVHVLDRRVLTAYEERVIVATKALRVFLQHAGVDEELQVTLMQMYGFSKKHVRSVDVDFLLEEDQDVDGLRFIHTPGHCPGQVCILLGDVVLSADHVLSRTTPHQAPESITAYTGLGHYLESLEKLRQVPGFDLALGGHEEPIPDVYKRIDQIRVSHLRKLDKVLTVIKSAKQPATIHETAKAMYPKVDGFHQLLAMEEVGAHVEHLYQRGELAACNLEELESEDHPAIRYRPT
jgi:glyoxylase-like metal-dependent hydrolase (beta-lactamase superfamily II)